jgi:alkanesulfonate monooxygenase SsuD/methylene tetrahydromethanopterin reductase-like flavin-dependent oxidoreductase (luciferase family)
MSSRVSIGIKTSPQAVDWTTLDGAWARIGEHEVFDSVWMNDHIIDASGDRGGASFEAITAMAALAHHVPGKLLGHGVLSNTFRHPVMLAKQATILDHVTGGRFVLGFGAGWHPGEHLPFGIPMPDMPERFDRFESAVHVLRALFSEEAGTEAGITRPDPFYPLDGATNLPGPLTPGGPPIWLGGQRKRGIALAARVAQGWYLPAVIPHEGAKPSDLDYFSDRRSALLAAMAEIGRDPAGFEFVAQVPTGGSAASRATSLDLARDAVRRGATHVVLGMPPALGAAGVDAVADDVAIPLREGLA